MSLQYYEQNITTKLKLTPDIQMNTALLNIIMMMLTGNSLSSDIITLSFLTDADSVTPSWVFT